jgi:hydrogenase maturation factor
MKRLIKFRLLNKKLFLKYAMPCLMEKLRRGEISEEEFTQLMKDFEKGEMPSIEKITELFSTAIPKILALGVDKKKFEGTEVQVDTELVRDYFWDEHIPVVMNKKLKKSECLVLPARVLKVNGDKAVVLTPLGEKEVKTAYLEKVKENDLLAVHYNYACEKINEKEFKRLAELLKKHSA